MPETTAPKEADSALKSASDRIRETAKWLILTLAAVGGVLTAGMQLSNLGSLTSGSDRWPTAVIGGSFAMLGAAFILGFAVWVATTQPLSWPSVRDNFSNLPELKDPALLQEVTDAGDLDTKFMAAFGARKKAIDERAAMPNDERNTKVRIADEELQRLDGIVHGMSDVASYLRLSRRWRKAAAGIGFGAAVSCVGITAFIWAINPPAAATASAASPVVLSAVSSGKISLTDAGKSAIGKKIGTSCVDKSELSVVVLGNTDSGPDVLVEEPGCEPVRLVLGSEWGSLSMMAAV